MTYLDDNAIQELYNKLERLVVYPGDRITSPVIRSTEEWILFNRIWNTLREALKCLDSLEFRDWQALTNPSSYKPISEYSSLLTRVIKKQLPVAEIISDPTELWDSDSSTSSHSNSILNADFCEILLPETMYDILELVMSFLYCTDNTVSLVILTNENPAKLAVENFLYIRCANIMLAIAELDRDLYELIVKTTQELKQSEDIQKIFKSFYFVLDPTCGPMIAKDQSPTSNTQVFTRNILRVRLETDTNQNDFESMASVINFTAVSNTVKTLTKICSQIFMAIKQPLKTYLVALMERYEKEDKEMSENVRMTISALLNNSLVITPTGKIYEAKYEEDHHSINFYEREVVPGVDRTPILNAAVIDENAVVDREQVPVQPDWREISLQVDNSLRQIETELGRRINVTRSQATRSQSYTIQPVEGAPDMNVDTTENEDDGTTQNRITLGGYGDGDRRQNNGQWEVYHLRVINGIMVGFWEAEDTNTTETNDDDNIDPIENDEIDEVVEVVEDNETEEDDVPNTTTDETNMDGNVRQIQVTRPDGTVVVMTL